MKTAFAISIGLALLALGCERNPRAHGAAAGFAAQTGGAPASAPLVRDAFAAKTLDDSKVSGPADAGMDSVSMPAQTIAPSMLIRTAQVSVEVTALDSGIVGVRALAQRVDGYVADVSVAEGRDQSHSATLEVRLPAARFDDALAGLRPLGRLESVNVSTADVGEEFVDVTARMNNARQLEARLLALLATRTGKLSDVLEVERELSRVREGIERYEGRLRYLRTRAAVSTISVTVHEPLPVVGERGSGSELEDAFRQAWRNFVGFLAQGIAAMGVLIPLGVIVSAAVVIARRLGIGRGRRAPAGA